MEMYQRTKGDRLFVLNELGAFCLAGNLILQTCTYKVCSSVQFILNDHYF